MRIPVVRYGDHTTTGGRVLATRAKIHDNGKKIALRGEKATCGNCQGSWPMFGTGERMCDDGTPVVLHGDKVLCPCGKNRVIAGDDSRCFYHRAPEEISHRDDIGIEAHHASTEVYDEQFTLLDDERRPIPDKRYRIVIDGDRIINGTTNARGQTERIATVSATRMELQLEK